MGYGIYSHVTHITSTRLRSSLPREMVFPQIHCHPLMNPYRVKVRESRDSEAHPRSLAIVFALDVTGSMGEIPELLARQELPTFMKALMDMKITDPQVLFMAVGDAYCDQAPLQVGQFESGADEMDQWLTWSYLEGGGGGRDTESYELAMYFLARHTDVDCWKKRQHRGYVFMTGDENPYPYVSHAQVRSIIGDDLDEDIPTESIVQELQKMYEPFFIIPDQKRRRRCEESWRKLLGDRVICMEDPKDIVHVCAGLVALCENAVSDLPALADRLCSNGLPRERVAAVVQALTPFAASLERDGAPTPRTVDAPLPDGNGPSYRKRRK